MSSIRSFGSFSIVRKAIHKKTGQAFAVKVIDKKSVGKDYEQSLQTEIDILRQVNHPNIICLKEIFNTSKKLYLVMELVTGGELFDRIIAKGHFSEKDAAELITKVIRSIEYLHARGIVHRDLKPENLLYADPSPTSEIKVADFGLAKIVGDDQVMSTTCGTPGYVAPEVLKNKGYDRQVDVWSIGVILYILLCGFPPFYEESTPLLFDQIMSGQYDFPEPYWTPVSDQAKDLIRHMLVVDPRQRYTTQQCLAHPWLSGAAKADKISLSKMMEFNARRKLKRAVMGVVAAQKMKNLLGAFGAGGGAHAADDDDDD